MKDRIAKWQQGFEVVAGGLGVIALLLGYSHGVGDNYIKFVEAFGWFAVSASAVDLIFRLNLKWDKKRPKGQYCYLDIAEYNDREVLKFIEDILIQEPIDLRVFATSTFFLSYKYEKMMFETLNKIASHEKESTHPNAVFVRIITNYNTDPRTQEWVKQIFDPREQVYGTLRELLNRKCAELRFWGAPIGLDLLIFKTKKSTKCILGIKEEDYNRYYGPNDKSRVEAKGRTYFFDDDHIAQSMLEYFLCFLKPLSREIRKLEDIDAS